MTDKKTLLVILILLILPSVALAQDGNYYKGYIVDNQGDTLRGSIVRENNYISPERVRFMLNGEETEYGANAIKAFYIEDLHFLFESHSISANPNNNTAEPIRDGLAELGPASRKQVRFVLTIAKTKSYGFYSYRESRGRERLYFGKNGELEELLFIKQLVGEFNTGNVKLSEKRRYRIQLLGYLIGCEPVKSKINNSVYQAKSMAGILKAYAKCKGDRILYGNDSKKRSGTKIQIGVNAAYGSVLASSTDASIFARARFTRAKLAELESGSWFEIGMTVGLKSDRDRRVGFRGELKLKSQTIETRFTRPFPVPNILGRANYIFNATYASLGFLVDFNLKHWENGGMFLEAGFFGGTAISGDLEIVEGVFIGNGEFVNTSETLDLIIRKTDLVGVVGIGLKYNKFGGSLRYNNSFSSGGEETTSLILNSISGVSLNLFYFFD